MSQRRKSDAFPMLVRCFRHQPRCSEEAESALTNELRQAGMVGSLEEVIVADSEYLDEERESRPVYALEDDPAWRGEGP